ncbi:hypothetical protein AAL_05570 [Moelleriella libera RCEF 2490]|uniref:Uncharacterized protein n=1 Tax=Moelleriella libera RCEF 2490 TaxID=1081109 RepID=A0A168AF45_9HYPO|nr:hypothetical protein AAL_05570 [Moelleriella libera RCEF 2490]
MDINDSEGTLVSTTEIQDAQRQPLKQPRESLTTDSIVERQAQGDLGRNSRDAGSIERRVDYCVVEEAQDAAQYGNYTGVWAGETADSVPQTRSRYFGDHIHQNAYRLSNKF